MEDRNRKKERVLAITSVVCAGLMFLGSYVTGMGIFIESRPVMFIGAISTGIFAVVTGISYRAMSKAAESDHDDHGPREIGEK